MMCKKRYQLCGPSSDIKISTLVLDWRGVPTASLGKRPRQSKTRVEIFISEPGPHKDTYNL